MSRRAAAARSRTMAKSIVPDSSAGVWALTRSAQLISMLPAGLTRAVAKMNTKGVRLHDSMQVKEYAWAGVWQHGPDGRGPRRPT